MHEDAGKQENSADCERDGAFCEDDAAQGSCFFKALIRDEERDENERHGSEIVVNERAARHEYPRQIRGQEADDTDERGAGVPFYGPYERVHGGGHARPEEQRVAEHRNGADVALAVGAVIAVVPHVADIERPLIPRGLKRVGRLQRGVVIIHMRLVRDEPAENIVAVMRQCGERQERRKVDAERNGDEQQAAPEAELYGFIKERFLHGGVAFLFAVRDDELAEEQHGEADCAIGDRPLACDAEPHEDAA